MIASGLTVLWGCNPPAPPGAPAAPPVIAGSAADAEAKATPVGNVAAPPPPAPVRSAPGPDAEAISAILTPKPPNVPSPSAVVKPKPRTSATDRGDVEPPIPRPEKLLPAPPPRKGHPPTPPHEPLPGQFSAGPEPPQLIPLPPEVLKLLVSDPRPESPLPGLSVFIPDRVPVNDPTAGPSYAGIVHTSVPGMSSFPAGPSPVVPDPFALGDQIRARPAAEIGLAPARR